MIMGERVPWKWVEITNYHQLARSISLPETNKQLAPENWWLEDDPASFWDAGC